MKKNELGFTIIEIMIVLSIIFIFLSLIFGIDMDLSCTSGEQAEETTNHGVYQLQWKYYCFFLLLL